MTRQECEPSIARTINRWPEPAAAAGSCHPVLRGGYRESGESWADLMRDCARRGAHTPVSALFLFEMSTTELFDLRFHGCTAESPCAGRPGPPGAAALPRTAVGAGTACSPM
ncbi:hypothetical protein DKG34_05930 [Streptomyces sp. NWU49]|nr:hypothetical protein DKG34_05930 [Streptomyces sp. NWU49]